MLHSTSLVRRVVPQASWDRPAGAFSFDPDYRIEAKANVEGVVFDPTEWVSVVFR